MDLAKNLKLKEVRLDDIRKEITDVSIKGTKMDIQKLGYSLSWVLGFQNNEPWNATT